MRVIPRSKARGVERRAPQGFVQGPAPAKRTGSEAERIVQEAVDKKRLATRLAKKAGWLKKQHLARQQRQRERSSCPTRSSAQSALAR